MKLRSLSQMIPMALACLATPSTVLATGQYNPLILLHDEAAYAAIASPEFWFELEMKDLATQYKVSEKYIPSINEAESPPPDKVEPPPVSTADPDSEEMKLYEAGADAYNKKEFATASTAWVKLLGLPAAQRHERSVWAEYMLGRMAIADGRPQEAPAHFQAARKLAAAGCEDSQGLASASYGWEAYVSIGTAPATAIELYLKQLATGDHRALRSIRMIIPYEWQSERMNRDAADAPDLSGWTKPEANPLLRQVLTRWLLAYGEDFNHRYSDETSTEESTAARWLTLMEQTKPAVAEADRLGWLAYREGAYEQAGRWLKLASQETPLSTWLSAKLALRKGDTLAAEKALNQAVKTIPDSTPHVADYAPLPPRSAVYADAAVVALRNDHYETSLAYFLEAGLWSDAAYVGERVMTLPELRKYVDAMKPQTIKNDLGDSIDAHEGLRSLLARRMVREDQEAAARPYFTEEDQKTLDRYLAALKQAQQTKLPAKERARAWWDAACIAQDGSLLRTSSGPDSMWEWQNGASSLPQLRRLGKEMASEFDGPSRDVTRPAKSYKPMKFGVAPSAEEKKRLAKHVLPYEYPSHYLWVGAALAKKAAALLPAGSEEKADVLNTAGSWMFDRDEKREEEFFFAIKATCPDTEIGRQVLEAKHTFFIPGPWSQALLNKEDQN
jgi:tetratricopeptide (TPR) repeat protein